MKKRIAVLVSLTLFFLLPALWAQADALLDFENGIDGFIQSGSCQLKQSPISYSGSFSLGVEGRGSNDYDAADYPMDSLNIQAGDQVTLSFYAYHQGQQAGIIKAGLAGGSYGELARGMVEPGVWTKLTGSFTASELYNIRFQTYGDNMNGVSFYVDDVKVSVVKNQTPEISDIFPDYFCGFEGEAGMDGWVARSNGDAHAAVVKDAANTGEASLLITGRSDDWNSPGRSFTFTEGMGYEAVCYVRQDSGKTVEFILSAAITRQGQESYVNLARVSVQSGKWTKITATYTAGAGIDNTVLYVETANAAELDFWMDDFSVTKKGQKYRNDLPSLKAVYKNDFLIGCALGQTQAANKERMDYLSGQFNIFTPENELKPENVFDEKASMELAKAGDNIHPAVKFSAAMPLLDYALKNGVAVHGHVLVWHSQTPRSFFTVDYTKDGELADRETMLLRLENYIAAIMDYLEENYPGVVISWDVVNEAVLDGNGKLRGPKTLDDKDGTFWMDTVGEDYILQAFTFARKYAPAGTKLFYNDYSVPYEPKLSGIKEIVRELAESDLIDGVGFQGHYQLTSPSIKQVEDAMAYFVGLGLGLRVSELDITIPDNTQDSLLDQARRYRSLMDLFQRFSNDLDAVIVWGTSDDLSWKSEGFPLLFDKDMNPKPAFWAWADPTQLPAQQQEANAYGPATLEEESFHLATAYHFGDHVFRVLYDESKLYFRVNVSDELVDEEDAVTVFVEDAQVTVQRKDCVQTASGYSANVEVPITKTGSLGFDVMVRDGQRYLAVNDRQNAGASRQMGVLHLLKLGPNAIAYAGKPDMEANRLDTIWQGVQSVPLSATASVNANEDGSVSAAFKVLWQPDRLYVLAEVIDPYLSDSNPSSYLQDSIEVFIDEGNHKTGEYEEDDGQYRVNFRNVLSIDHGSVQPVTRAFATDTGFVVEMAIPYSGSMTQGDVLGFDVRYNNATADGGRTMLNFSDASDSGWKDTRVFGLLELK